MSPRRTPDAVERAPLAQVLDARVDEPRIRRVWRGLEPQLAAVRGERTPDPMRRLALAGSLAVIAIVALAFVLRPAAEPVRFLALENGGAPAAFTAREAEVVRFADGSHLELAAGAEVVPTLNDAQAFELTLTHGAVQFGVTPGGPRRWRIDCGLAIVEVVGTEFRVDRADDGVRVSVSRGHVRVTARDARVWDLLAGDEVWVEAPAFAVAPAEATPPVATLSVAEPTDPAPAPVAEVVGAAPRAIEAVLPPRAIRWTELAESGAYDRAYEVLREDVDPHDDVAVAGPRELMLLADVARLSGHPAEAVAPLERLLSLHQDAPEASLAAVVLGRLQQDALHAPAEAARAFERAEQIGVPAPLVADVEGRLALAYLALGDPRGVERARRYLAAHADGPLASALAARLD